MPAWRSREQYTGFWKYLDLSSTVRQWLSPQTIKEQPPDFAEQNDKNKDGMIELSEIPEQWREQKKAKPADDDLVYPGYPIRTQLHRFEQDEEAGVSRAEWRAAQAHKWSSIWLWPAVMAAATSLLFLIGFHDRPDRQTIEAMAEESALGPGEGPEPQVG
ncbi:MAG: hypothetical protein B7Z73_06430 [Planctomycetia bacterium 21-64-5]|nr:MAG: hypothetical protein B7Z73_06430 [Planctomycetia bacterium 21-64-5]